MKSEMQLAEIYKSILMENRPDDSTLRKIKKFCDSWNAGNLFGNARSMKVAYRYLDSLNEWIREHWGQDTEEGKLVEYIHGSLVGVIEWTTFNGRDKEKGGMRNKTKK